MSEPIDLLSVLFQDENLIAINKPHGLAVHRSKLVGNAEEFALSMLRDQIGMKVYPVHRLDRKTSGVLLFALNKDTLRAYSTLFQERKAEKTYFAIVRGFTPEKWKIDYPLANHKGVKSEAVTDFITIEKTEIPLASGKHLSSRYSLIKAFPKTGRMHQIRKHLNHVRHPIIGDRPHGCNKQNKLLLTHFQLSHMMLHAAELCFPSMNIKIEAPLSREFLRMKSELKFSC